MPTAAVRLLEIEGEVGVWATGEEGWEETDSLRASAVAMTLGQARQASRDTGDRGRADTTRRYRLRPITTSSMEEVGVAVTIPTRHAAVQG